MRNSDLSSVYDYARKVLDDPPQGVYQKKASELKKEIAAEKKEYKHTNGTKKSKSTIVIVSVICICAVFAAAYFLKGIDHNNTDLTAPDIQETASVVVTEENITEAVTSAAVETAENTSVTAASVPTEEVSETAEKISESTVPTSQSTIAETDEDSAESYNGFNLGEIVYYSGTVHYVSCDSAELAGACVGGKAMISVIKPDAKHKFHLVAADDNCTVYGWVDEYFVTKINAAE